jgi:uncharacterized membrane protein
MEAAGDSGTALQADLRTLGRESANRAGLTAVRAQRVVFGGTALYVIIFVTAAVVAYLAHDVARLDLGDMVQAIWSTTQGRFLESTTESGLQVSRLAGHVDPFLVLLVPLWWVWPSPLMLVLFEIGAVASGVLPVYWLARKHLRSERAAAHLSFAYLLYPATQCNALGIHESVHSVSIAIPLVLFAIWFLDEERLVLFAVFALLAATTKEEIAASVGCLGLWYAVRHKRWGVGLLIFGLGMAISLVNFLVIIPHFSPSGVNPFAGRYDKVGDSPQGILHTAVTDPVTFIHAMVSWHKLLYLVLMLAPFLFLWVLEPLLFLGALPDLAINLLSSKPEQTGIFWQYTAGIVPFVVAATILGASRLKRDPGSTSLAVLGAVASLAVLSPIYAVVVTDLAHVRPSDARHSAQSRALALIPPGVPVSASNQLGGLLSERRYIYVFPVKKRAEWVIVDSRDSTYGDRPGWYRRHITAVVASPSWRVVYRSQGVEVLRRKH